MEAPSGPVVLLVDDDPDVRELVAGALERHGFSVLAVGSGEAALEAAGAHAVDILLSDVMLPAIDGFETARRLRASRPNLPVLLMSGYVARDTVDRHAAVSPVIRKPFSMAELVGRLREVLASRPDRPPAA